MPRHAHLLVVAVALGVVCFTPAGVDAATIAPAIEAASGGQFDGAASELSAEPATRAAAASLTPKPADFTNDGFDDIVLPAYRGSLTVGGVLKEATGYLYVIPGSVGGTDLPNAESLQQETVGGSSGDFDHFGATVATGDFNGDGRSDLAIGAPKDDVGAAIAAGSVGVAYGAGARPVRRFHQDSSGIGDGAEEFDGFGSALTSSDFDGDGYDDLAVGVPFEDLPGANGAGAVHVLYGGATGLGTSGGQFFVQSLSGIGDKPEFLDEFGLRLAAGDFNGDGYGDLVVSAPEEGLATRSSSGAVHVILGGSNGLRSSRSGLFTQDTTGIGDTAEFNDRFGLALAVGNFNGDRYADLAIAAPFESFGSASVAGAVHILFGSASGISTTGDLLLTENTAGIAGSAQPFAKFGFELAAGDLDGDGYDDLAVGEPFKDNVAGAVDWNRDDGWVHIVFGGASGSTGSRAQVFSQNTDGIPDKCEIGDWFGRSLAVADVDGDGDGDLVVGASREDAGGFTDLGVVHVLKGYSRGVATSADEYFVGAEPNARFGSSVTSTVFQGTRNGTDENFQLMTLRPLATATDETRR